MTRQGQLAPGVVHVRLSGLPADADALAAVPASTPAVQILTGPGGPYPSRRRPGHRLSLTLRLTPAATTETGSRSRMTTSAPPPSDPELAADPDYRQAAAEDWYGRVADYYAEQQAEVDEETRYLATQADRDAGIDARHMDAQHQDAPAENAARDPQAPEPEAGA